MPSAKPSRHDSAELHHVEDTLHYYSVWYDNTVSPYPEVTITATENIKLDDDSYKLFEECIVEKIDDKCVGVVNVIYRGICARSPREFN